MSASILKTCSICIDDRPLTFFETLHSGCAGVGDTVCMDCAKQHSKAEVTGKIGIRVACPLGASICTGELVAADLIRMGCNMMAECLGDNQFRFLISSERDFRPCTAPGCGYGWIHEGGDANPIMTCIRCSHKSCFTDRTPWHSGLTCEQYRQDLERKGDLDRTMALIQKIAKRCPKCGTGIQKNEGCDHMTCLCGGQFCWLCLTDWAVIIANDNSRHAPTCAMWRPRRA